MSPNEVLLVVTSNAGLAEPIAHEIARVGGLVARAGAYPAGLPDER